MQTVDDTHVMVQTINYSDKFDGERDFALDGNFLVSDEFKKAVEEAKYRKDLLDKGGK